MLIKSDIQLFLINCSLFIVLIVSFSLGLFILSDLLLKQRIKQVLQIRDDIKIVFAGDSKVEAAVDDSLIANSINIAQSGEAYLYSYVKLRSLLEYNNHINTVFIGYSLHNLIQSTEKLWLFNNEFVIEKIKTYNYLLNGSEKYFIIKNNPGAYLKGIFLSVLNNFSIYLKSFNSKISNERIINFGGYQYLNRDKLKEDIKRRENLKINSSTEQLQEKGVFQEKYLKMISQLCRQKSVKLVLLITPEYKYQAPEFNDENKNILTSVNNLLAQDSLLDLSAFYLPDSCYGDVSHLNYKGAKIFSQYLNEKLHSNQKNSTIIKEN